MQLTRGLILLGCAIAAHGLRGTLDSEDASFSYETIPGSFIQTEPGVDPRRIGPTPPRFGLLDPSPTRWKNFTDTVTKLNHDSPPNVRYRVFYLERHGESVYNLGEAYYGPRAWRRHWSLLYGNGTVVWGPDPELTELGITQALKPNALWKQERFVTPLADGLILNHQPEGHGLLPVLQRGIPLPQKLYTSPLSRAVHTMNLTYSELTMGDVKPVITEGFRKVIGMHTPEKRRSRSYLAKTFPLFEFEEGFTEEDELWKPDIRETRDEVDVRVRNAYDRIVQETWDTGNTYIAITTHGSIVTSSLRIFNHPRYKLPTGGVLPILVKATKIQN